MMQGLPLNVLFNHDQFWITFKSVQLESFASNAIWWNLSKGMLIGKGRILEVVMMTDKLLAVVLLVAVVNCWMISWLYFLTWLSGRQVQPAFQHDPLCSQVLAGDYLSCEENYKDGDDSDENVDIGDDGNLLDSIRWSWYSSPLCGNQQGHSQECPGGHKDEYG